AARGSVARARARTREALVRRYSDDASGLAVAEKALEERPKDPALQLLAVSFHLRTPEERKAAEESLPRLAREPGTRTEAAHAWVVLVGLRAARKDGAAALEAAKLALAGREDAETLAALAEALGVSGPSAVG